MMEEKNQIAQYFCAVIKKAVEKQFADIHSGLRQAAASKWFSIQLKEMFFNGDFPFRCALALLYVNDLLKTIEAFEEMTDGLDGPKQIIKNLRNTLR